jgi:hypothetical protein
LGDPKNIHVEVTDGIPALFVTGTNVVPPSVDMPRISGNIIVGFGIRAAPEYGSTMEAQFDDFRVYAMM